MKIEQLIVQYLYNHKQVSVQDIGIFTLSPDVVMPTESEKETILPDNAIQFEYNAKAVKDEGLIDFIVEHTRKIKPLATSDLESYTMLSRQFLNIGKPMEIEGLGTLIKNQQGTYEFIQGHTVNPKLENNTVRIKEKIQDEISFTTPPKEAPANKGLLMLLGTLVLIGVAGALYYFLVYNKNNDIPVEETQQVEPLTDTLINTRDTSLSQDSVLMPKTDSTLTAVSQPATTKDGYTFKIVLKEYPTRMAADKAFNKLTSYGHTLIVSQKDSSAFKLSMPFTTALSDTARAKDSLRVFFGGRPYVDL
jgi:hypothetical protein